MKKRILNSLLALSMSVLFFLGTETHANAIGNTIGNTAKTADNTIDSTIENLISNPGVIVLDEENLPVSEIKLIIAKYSGNKWNIIADTITDEKGNAIFDITSEDGFNSCYRITFDESTAEISSKASEAAIYVYITSKGEVSYSKTFNETTGLLGDGAASKIKTLRLYK